MMSISDLSGRAQPGSSFLVVRCKHCAVDCRWYSVRGKETDALGETRASSRDPTGA